jgi:hypothetical protein
MTQTRLLIFVLMVIVALASCSWLGDEKTIKSLSSQ